MIEARMPDGTTLQFPDGTDDGVIDKAAQDYIASSKPPLTTVQSIGRGIGLGTRATVEGLAALPGMALDALTSHARSSARDYGLTVDQRPPSEIIAGWLDAAGLPQPETPLEEVTSGAVRGGAASLPFMGAGAALGLPTQMAKAGQIVPLSRAATMLTAAPVGQVVGAASGAGGSEGLRQAGYPPWVQAAGGAALGMAGYGATELAGAGLRAMRGAPAVPGAIAPPRTADEAKAIASGLYDKADEVGGTLTPEFTNEVRDVAKKIGKQTGPGVATVGETPIAALNKRWEALADQPLTLKGLQEMDEGLSELIDNHLKPNGGLTKAGQNLQNVQWKLRDLVKEADPSHVVGGTEGFDALALGRKAWSQAQKMADIQRIADRAALIDNPATSIRTGIRTLLSNPSLKRGYSDQEIAALKTAANRGVLGNLMHVFGSRLIPLGAGGAIGAGSGFLPGMVAAGGAHAVTTGIRGVGTYIQDRRLQDVMNVLGKSVPPAAGTPAPYVASAPQNTLLPGAIGSAAAAEAARLARVRNPLAPP